MNNLDDDKDISIDHKPLKFRNPNSTFGKGLMILGSLLVLLNLNSTHFEWIIGLIIFLVGWKKTYRS